MNMKLFLLLLFKHLKIKLHFSAYNLKDLIFSMLHGMPAQTSNEKGVHLSVCLSVYPSVKCMDCDKIEERSVHIFIPYKRSFSLLF